MITVVSKMIRNYKLTATITGRSDTYFILLASTFI